MPPVVNKEVNITEFYSLTQGYTAVRWQSQDTDLGRPM